MPPVPKQIILKKLRDFVTKIPRKLRFDFFVFFFAIFLRSYLSRMRSVAQAGRGHTKY